MKYFAVMNYHIVPFLLILLSLAGVIVVLIRRFPQLTLLDVDTIPEVRAEKKKTEFLKKRVEAKGQEAQKKRREQWKPVVEQMVKVQNFFRRYVGDLERRLAHKRMNRVETAEQKGQKREELRSIVHDADLARQSEDFEAAEKKCIAAIRIDPKNPEPYRSLSEVYLAQGQTTEAKETLLFLHQMEPNDDMVLVRLAELSEQENNIQSAIEYYQQAVLLNDHLPQRFAKLAQLLQQIEQYPTALEAIRQAVEIEPQNPKFLDMMVEISIMVGDKALSEQAFHGLRMVNPENQKLPSLKERIQKMV
jgi:tetratricopeptide (TPR) repeat protein